MIGNLGNAQIIHEHPCLSGCKKTTGKTTRFQYVNSRNTMLNLYEIFEKLHCSGLHYSTNSRIFFSCSESSHHRSDRSWLRRPMLTPLKRDPTSVAQRG